MRLVLIMVLLLVAAAGALGYRTLAAAGTFKTVTDRFAGTCELVSAPKGPEDIAADRVARVLYISSTDRRAIMRGSTEARGDIFAMRLDALDEGPVPLTGVASNAPAQFRPHGISLYTGPDGRQTLMAINHPGEGLPSTIEIFEVTGATSGRPVLRHRRTVSDPLLTSPNDVAAVDHDRFYATNDHGSAPGVFRMLETYLILPWTTAVYFDGAAMSVAVSGLTFANGIAASDDGQRLYIAETTGRTLTAFARDPATGALRKTSHLFIDTGLDNIDIDDAGRLWIAAHPQMLALASHAEHADALSPSEVVVVRETAGQLQAESVLTDTGALMSGASTAIALDDGRLIVSSIFDPKLLVCRRAAGS